MLVSGVLVSVPVALESSDEEEDAEQAAQPYRREQYVEIRAGHKISFTVGRTLSTTPRLKTKVRPNVSLRLSNLRARSKSAGKRRAKGVQAKLCCLTHPRLLRGHAAD